MLETNIPGATVDGGAVSVMFAIDGNYSANFSVSDDASTVNATVTVEVLAVDDPPAFDPPALFWGVEDQAVVLDFAPSIFDEDSPDPALSLSTDLQGAVVAGFQISVNRTLPGDEPFNVTVADATTSITRPSVLRIVPGNDAPAWVASPSLLPTEDVPYTVDLLPLVFDEDTPPSGLAFSVASAYGSVNGSALTLLYPEGVLADDIAVTVSDGVASATITLHATVARVNDLPTLVGDPPNDLQPNSTIAFQFRAQDAEAPISVYFVLDGGPSWVTVSASGLLTMSPPSQTHGHYTYNVTVVDGDGGSARRSFLIGVDNRAPTIGDIPRAATTNQLYVTAVAVADVDGDELSVAMICDDTRVTFNPALRQIRWYTDYPHADGVPFELLVDITIHASDGIAEVYRTFTVVVRDPPDRPPEINRSFAPLDGHPNETVALDLRNLTANYTYDPDDLPGNLTWHVAGGLDSAVATFTFDPFSQVLNITFRELGNTSLALFVEDPSGRASNVTLLLIRTVPVVVEPPVAPASEFPWWVLLVVAAGGIGVAVAARRARAARIQAPAEARPASALAASFDRPTYLVEDVLLLTRGGRLVLTHGTTEGHDDPDVVGSMLVAVQEFVRDAYKTGGAVSQMSFGDDTVLFERGDHVILAVNVYGTAPPALRESMREAVERVERAFAGVIDKWDGDRSSLPGLDALLAPLWQGSKGVAREDVRAALQGADVKMLSAVEFFQGYVRVRIGIVNNTPASIHGVVAEVDFNGDVLRLARIEPATYKTAGGRVVLGTVGRGEKVALAYYLDPQICTISSIDGSCVYKDREGRQRVVEMRSRSAEVVCPLFFTKEQANTAMLKRLVETDLNLYDARGYRFRKDISDGQLRGMFEALRSTVMAHDVQLVRSIEGRRPFSAEAWFYGRTQVKGLQVVIRAAVSREKGRAEFFVASTAMAPITGLLAELHRTFRASAAERLKELGIEPLFDERFVRDYALSAARSSVVEGEAEPGEMEG